MQKKSSRRWTLNGLNLTQFKNSIFDDPCLCYNHNNGNVDGGHLFGIYV